MADEPTTSALDDPDKTDKLPILRGGEPDAEFGDDAVPLDRSAVPARPAAATGKPAFVRGGTRLDLPRLDETVRSVEDRIARQAADHAALARTLERSRESEAAAVSRANALAAEVASLRTALEAERERALQIERSLFEKTSTVELGRARIQEIQRECARLGEEARSFKDALATRDATIVQVLNSLGERDAQLTALQREHASIVPELTAKAHAADQSAAELEAARAKIGELKLDLDSRTGELGALSTRLAKSETDLAHALREVAALKARAAAYLETLQSREWRRTYQHSRWHAADASPQALQTAVLALEAQRDELKRKLAEPGAAQSPPSAPSPAATDARDAAVRDQELAAAKRTIESQAKQIAGLEANAEATQEEMTVLLAHLQAARRQEPRDEIDGKRAAERKRLTDELMERTARVTELESENRQLQTNIERLRGALDEREFLIRRLERSESSNASALGRLQNTIERLGAASLPQTEAPDLELTPRPLVPAPVGPAPLGRPTPPATGASEPAKLVRIDGGKAVTYTLQRRNQVGRAPGTEVHIDSSTVSRVHALIVTAPGGAIIEDVKSTNGTYINGHRVTRQRLHDGDLLTIGEAQFRFVAERSSPVTGPSAGDAVPAPAAASAGEPAPGPAPSAPRSPAKPPE
jgi:chromosome segregation ATPase